MSRFLRKLSELLIGTDEREDFPPVLPLTDVVPERFTYKGTMYLYESLDMLGQAYTYLASTESPDPCAKLLGKTSFTLSLDREVTLRSLQRVQPSDALPGHWVDDLQKGVDKRAELIKKVGKDYD